MQFSWLLPERSANSASSVSITMSIIEGFRLKSLSNSFASHFEALPNTIISIPGSGWLIARDTELRSSLPSRYITIIRVVSVMVFHVFCIEYISLSLSSASLYFCLSGSGNNFSGNKDSSVVLSMAFSGSLLDLFWSCTIGFSLYFFIGSITL